MTPSNYRVRRATLDDRAGLKELWDMMHLPADELEKRLPEFQVVEAADGKLAGAIGIQIARPHARLHSESFRDFGAADELRALLLERVRSLASNHGVLRLWTQEKSPFWLRQGFQPAGAEVIKRLPETWAGADWLTLQLKDEEAFVSVDKELALFMEAEKQSTAHALEQARTLKTIIITIVLIVGICFMVAAVYLFFRSRGLAPPAR